ncbi:MAG: cadherin domain-containing protein [Bacteroidales bacterium]|nr:cadherin domain-containing protein [Bacteroidales bacterium]
MKTLSRIAGAFLLSTLFFSCNKNEFAPEIVDQEFSVEENSPAGTVIGRVEASDRDEGQVLAYAIIDGNDEGICTIDPSGGTLSVLDPANLNYEHITQLP